MTPHEARRVAIAWIVRIQRESRQAMKKEQMMRLRPGDAAVVMRHFRAIRCARDLAFYQRVSRLLRLHAQAEQMLSSWIGHCRNFLHLVCHLVHGGEWFYANNVVMRFIEIKEVHARAVRQECRTKGYDLRAQWLVIGKSFHWALGYVSDKAI